MVIKRHMQFRQKRKKIHLNPALGPPRYNGHLVITATFLLPGKTAICVKQKPSLIRPPVNVANFFCPLVSVLTGLHCTAKEGLHEAAPKRQFKEYYGIFHPSQLLGQSEGTEWGARDGAVAKVLAATRLSPVWHRCKFWCWHHVWDEFVVDSLPLPWVVFLWYASFSLSSKTRNGKRKTTANMYVDMLPLDHYFIHY